jgi:hypothetical protein
MTGEGKLMKAREGDIVETCDGVIFDVKGLVHPSDRIVAFVRYFPDEEGDRKKGRLAYGKVYSLSERYVLLRERFPQYLVWDPVFDEIICEVPVSDLKKRYDPLEKLKHLKDAEGLDSLESKALQLAHLLKEKSHVLWNALGISGSILVGLHRASSDIDPIVYGSENCRKVHSALQNMLNDRRSLLKPYNKKELRSLFDFRSKDTAMVFEDFVRTESRKAFQGRFMETDYFIRFVKDWSEIDEKYGDVQYKNFGYAKITGTVVDDSESIFTPCKYLLENTTVIDGSRLSPITEIASFRGRFCEQARNGETVIAQGKVEQVKDVKRGYERLRLLIGNQSSDYMTLA